MNIKNLVKGLKVVAAVAMVGVVSGCASNPVGRLSMGEVRGVHTGEGLLKDRPYRFNDRLFMRGDMTDAEIAQKNWALLGFANDAFGGGIYVWAVIPPSITTEEGDFVEIISGGFTSGQQFVPHTITRITRKHDDKSEGGCNWGGAIPGIMSRKIYCDGKEQINLSPEEAWQPQRQR